MKVIFGGFLATGALAFGAGRHEAISTLPGPFKATAPATSTGASPEDLCYGTCQVIGGKKFCSFETIFDPHASSTGYFKFTECGDTAQPTLALERGVTYAFAQVHESNWMHPLGFAYFPDGAHKDVDELEPSISQSGSSCAEDHTCQAPMYYRNDDFLGTSYDNSVSPARGGDDFGLDVYEPSFFLGRAEWLEDGDKIVRLTLTDAAYDNDLFYFCHIHDNMSGRIKVVDGTGALLNAENVPALGYELSYPSDFDSSCGTYGLGGYEQGAGKCAGLEFFCAEGGYEGKLSLYGRCLHAMDCHMHQGMKNVLHSNPIVSFVQQMIPHHENAVNMAKLALKQQALDLTDEGDSEIHQLLWEVINNQNRQIDQMRAWAENNGYNSQDLCDA